MTGKFYIITDPCYLMNDEQWREFGNKQEYKVRALEKPFRFMFNKSGVQRGMCKILLSEETPNGDGGMLYKGQDIGVDAGLLCIAEIPKSVAESESLGARFETLEQAFDAFPEIIKEF